MKHYNEVLKEIVLDRLKVLEEIHTKLPTVWQSAHQDLEKIYSLWLQWLALPKEQQKTYARGLFWQGSIKELCVMKAKEYPYTVVSVDGSQIYPDRHHGLSCALINIGYVRFAYDVASTAVLDSYPRIVADITTTEAVDFYRFEQELYMLVTLIPEASDHVGMLDGSLALGYIENYSHALRSDFLNRFIQVCQTLHQKRILYCAYTSLPASSETIKIIENFVQGGEYSVQWSLFDDTSVCGMWLRPGLRTVACIPLVGIVMEYPRDVRPVLCFIHTGTEIARLEVPLWIYENNDLYEHVCAVVCDQIQKGYGYPLCVSEAHEQAIVKAADREFFIDVLCQVARQKGIVVQNSSKLYKKRMSSY